LRQSQIHLQRAAVTSLTCKQIAEIDQHSTFVPTTERPKVENTIRPHFSPCWPAL
jgi:hypothetical protein